MQAPRRCMAGSARCIGKQAQDYAYYPMWFYSLQIIFPCKWVATLAAIYRKTTSLAFFFRPMSRSLCICFHISPPVEHPPRHLPRHADHPVLCSSMLSPAVPRPRQIPAKPRFSRNPGCASFPLGALLIRANQDFVKAWWIMP